MNFVYYADVTYFYAVLFHISSAILCSFSTKMHNISYFSGWFNPSLMEKLWFDNSKLAGWFTKGRDILPSFWHSSPSHYWHYIWKLSHLLGSILWFMIPTKKRNGDQWSFNKSSYYSYYPSSHVWLVAGMQCKAILIKKNIYKCLEFISKYFQPLVNSGNPLQCILWRGNRGQGALLHKPKTSGGMMMSRFLNIFNTGQLILSA